MKSKIAAISVSPDITLYHIGPPLDHGPLPSFFYFAISGPDSLTLDPFNQPVQFLQGTMIRVFSMTLPGHEADLPKENAMNLWAEDISNGRNTLGEFLESVTVALDFAVKEKFVDPNHLAVGGLSRGAFIASHVCARDDRFKCLLGFAPMTSLSSIKEFANLKNAKTVDQFDLSHLSEKLSKRHCRFYIGNCDTRVGTKACFDFAMSIVDAAKSNKIRSPQVECFISPSIGKDGHGTSPEIFQQGAAWVLQCLTSSS